MKTFYQRQCPNCKQDKTFLPQHKNKKKDKGKGILPPSKAKNSFQIALQMKFK